MVAQDTALGAPSASSAVELHVAPDPGPALKLIAAAASELVNTLPASSTATHESDAKHETASRPSAGSIRRLCQAAAPPVGSVLSTALPSLSTATQSALEAQETAESDAAIATGPDHAPDTATVGLVLKSA